MERINCELYPCHFPKQDCTFCFCPFYPCQDPRTGGRLSGVWNCEGCALIHRQEIVDMVMEGLMRGEELSLIWTRVERFL